MTNLKKLLGVKDLSSLTSEELEAHLNSDCPEEREDARHYRNNAICNEVIDGLFKSHPIDLSDVVEIGIMTTVKIMMGHAKDEAHLILLYNAVLTRLEHMVASNISQIGNEKNMFSIRSKRGLN